MHEKSDASTGGILPSGSSSSISRFTLKEDRLYAVTETDLITFSIADVHTITEVNRIQISHERSIETIYPMQQYLFLGAVTGMYVYDISNPDRPSYISQLNHAISCDPVVSQGNTAYVTLSSFGRNCNTGENRLEVIDISDIQNPTVLQRYALDTPGALAIDTNTLFVVVDTEGERNIKVLDVSTSENIQVRTTLIDARFRDILVSQKRLYALAEDGLYIYDYANLDQIYLLGKYVQEN